jgi:hypothetical protein
VGIVIVCSFFKIRAKVAPFFQIAKKKASVFTFRAPARSYFPTVFCCAHLRVSTFQLFLWNSHLRVPTFQLFLWNSHLRVPIFQLFLWNSHLRVPTFRPVFRSDIPAAG